MLIPIVGHIALRARLNASIARGALPSSLLLHGPEGGGKERLALWIAQRLLCDAPTATGEPCGACQHCTYVVKGVHPDLHWYFPVAQVKGNPPEPDDVREHLAEAIETRLEKTGVWERTAQTESIFAWVMHGLLKRAAFTPSLAPRKVFVVADAHRLVPQEGEDTASNAFLKLLEEPGANTTIILTTSTPSALLPTIRSRVARLWVAPLAPGELRALAALGVVPKESDAAHKRASAMLAAARGGALQRYRYAAGVGSAGARGEFSESLAVLTALLHTQARTAAESGAHDAAANAARAIAVVEHTKRLAHNNINPQLLTVTLLDQLAPLVAPPLAP